MGKAAASAAAAVVGVSDHAGWAVLVTAAADGALLDRRRIALVDERLPVMPHHHDGQHLPIDQAVALVERVRASAERCAAWGLAELAQALPGRQLAVALRACQPLPETIAERIQNYRAMCVADWVMYRRAIAAAAQACGWRVHWYDPKQVFDAARAALGGKDLEAHFRRVKQSVAPPWDKDHKLAMAAAIAAGR